MKKIKMVMTILCVMVMALGIGTNASALTIDATDYDLVTYPYGDGTTWWADYVGNPDADNIETIVGYGGDLSELYKYDDYTTSITFDTDVRPTYLLVKDGNHDPRWYIFLLNDLDSDPTNDLGWNGTEDITLSLFWGDAPDGQGAISHVSMYGPIGVPEPTTLLLLGFGLIGLVGFRRK